jgi:methyl-accepting chemotaxis protein
VKNLASQTGRATGDIQSQISSIQEETERAVASIGSIAQTIGSISEITTEVVTGIEQQSLATGEIARNVAQASEGTVVVTENIAGVTASAERTDGAAVEMVEAAQRLAADMSELRRLVDRYTEVVRAA